MSFIWDDSDLINKLLKSGQDFEDRFTRRGQAAVDANAALNQILEKLELQLHPENKDPNAAPDISTQSDQPAVLNSTALESLGALCSFLAYNTITVNGQRISYTENPQNENYQFVQLEPNALFNETPDRQIQTKGFYVNIALLKSYLNSLLAQLHQKPNTVMQVQVSKIIDEANDSLDTGLGKTYQPSVPSLPDNQVLDNVPKDFKKQDPVNQQGAVPLTFGDIKSIESFNGWLNDKGISMDGRMINHPQFDKCGVAAILHSRAKMLLGNARDDKQKNMYTLYMQNMEKIGSSIEGCNLASGTSNKDKGIGGAATAADLMRVIEALPLRMEDIDFGRINEFFDTYRKVLSPTSASMQTTMSNCEASMQKATALTETGMDNFPMSANIQQIGTWLIQPKGQTQAFGLVEQLRYIISNVAAVISHFKNAEGRVLARDYPQQVAAINTQIGNEANSQGIAGNNLNSLQVWYNQAQSQSQQNQPPGKYKGW